MIKKKAIFSFVVWNWRLELACKVTMEKDYKTIESMEIELSGSAVRKNSDRLSKILADDFEEVGKSGRVFNKKEIISLLVNDEFQQIKLTNFRFKKLSDSSILVRYKSHCNSKKALRSSIWVKNNSSWQLLYHQGTECE